MKKLVKIKLVNWHYIWDETINLEGNTLITGANATGKSTIMDAITYVLTAGETKFNMAANDKSKRDLRGYVKCKLGRNDKEYLRDGDITGHIALEFHDEKTGTNFTVGAVIDAFGDLTPVKSLFYKSEEGINDDMFFEPLEPDKKTGKARKRVYGTVDFRKHNSFFQYFLTNKEAKRAFRTAFGSINEDFYHLIPKALAFKPISDVKEFIYQNILEEKEIDVSAIKGSVHAFKSLEAKLKLTQEKIAKLHDIDNVYQEIEKINEDKAYIEYLKHLFDIEDVKGRIRKSKSLIDKNKVQKETKEKQITDIEKENQALNDRSRELYSLLRTNDKFKAEEYINSEIERTKNNIQALENNQKDFLKRASEFKDTLITLRKISNENLYSVGSNINVTLINQMQVEDTKIRLTDFYNQIQILKNKKNQELGRINGEIQSVIDEINDITKYQRNAQQNRLNYPADVMGVKNEIEEGLSRIYNYKVSVHILSDLLEISNPKWADTVEVFLANRRFMLIVEPRYFDNALQIFNRVRSRYRLYGIGLVNTKMISKFQDYEKNSLASIIETENKDARCYVNFLCGNVIMVDKPEELENYSIAVTNDYLIYRSYAVTQMNPNIPKPFIGKNAAKQSLADLEIRSKEAKNKYNELHTKEDALQRETSLIDSLNVRQLINDVDDALELSKEKQALQDLKKQKERTSKETPDELEQDYNKISLTIKDNDAKKMEISKEIGSIDNTIQTLLEQIDNDVKAVAGLEKQLKDIQGDNAIFAEKAKAEYNRIMAESSFAKALQNYNLEYDQYEKSYQTLLDSLAMKQFEYINAYASNFATGLSEMSKYSQELQKLEKSELISYEKEVRDAREKAELVFKEDFIAKLRNNILTAEQEISKINETLSNIKFGNDTYEFIFPRSAEYAEFYDMVTSDLVNKDEGLLTYDFQSKYNEQINDLFDSLSVDDLNSNGAINKFTDYRTYMDYDIQIKNQDGTMNYSKVFREKSGGETQVPFYVAIVASFVRVYTQNGFSQSDPIGLVLFDEVFDKMDGNRMRAMMNFISSMPLQVLIACPYDKMDLLQEYADTTLILVRQNTRATVLPVKRKKDISNKFEDEEDEEA